MPVILVKFYNFGTSILWTKDFARNLPKYRGFTAYGVYRVVCLYGGV